MSLTANRVSLKYGDGDTETFAVREASLEIPDRGFYVIMGPSGSGKSSLLYLLSGLKLPSSGEVMYRGRSLSGSGEAARTQTRREQFGFVFQQPFLLNYLTAKENIMVAANRQDRTSEKSVMLLMEELQIESLAERVPAHLSGGEKQRVIVARSMINRPAIIFADEPTAALDHANGHIVIDLLRRYQDKGTVVVVTHDPTMVAEADRVYQMLDGKLIES